MCPGPGHWAVVRVALANVWTKPRVSAALPAMVASSGEARLTGAFATNRDQFKRDPDPSMFS
jgi:hypothetical protein